MSILTHSPAIVRDGLVLCLDAGAVRSYDPSTNSGTELVTNGTMEADSNWSNYNSPTANARSSTQAKVGTYSRKFVADSTYDGIMSDTFTTVANKVYIVSAWVYADDQSGVHIQLLDGDESSGTGHNQNTNHAVTRDEWTHLEIPISVSTGGSSSRVTFQSASGDATGTWYIDQVSVREKSVWYDLSGNFNDGAMSSVIQTAESGAGGTRSFDFDGTSDYIDCGTGFNHTAAMTCEVWALIKAGSGAGGQVLFGQWFNSSAKRKWYIGTDTTTLYFYIDSAGSGTFTSVNAGAYPTDGEFHSYSFVYIPSASLTAYVDGVVVGTDTSSVASSIYSATDVNIYMGRDEAGSYFEGQIGSSKIYTRALSQAEIQQNYRTHKGRFGK